MLTISEPAAQFLADARAERDMPSDATVRIATPDDGMNPDGVNPGLTVGFVDAPFSGDVAFDAHGLAVCIAPEAVDLLDTAVLDVVEDHEGTQLVLVPAG